MKKTYTMTIEVEVSKDQEKDLDDAMSHNACKAVMDSVNGHGSINSFSFLPVKEQDD